MWDELGVVDGVEHGLSDNIELSVVIGCASLESQSDSTCGKLKRVDYDVTF